MALSYTTKMTWEHFWDSQENNPNCELAFQYNGKTYILLHESYIWKIAEYDDSLYISGKSLLECPEKKQGHRNYHSDENWNDSIQKCFELLTTPVFDGKSFKDIIDDILFED